MTRIAQEARKNPAGVAILERGQMAIARGEILILARCKPEIATLRDVDTCYQDLPIIHRGHHMFRDSMTYAVRTSSYETPCNSHFKPVHFISGYYRSQKSKNTLSNIKWLPVNIPQPTTILTTEKELYEGIQDFLAKHQHFQKSQERVMVQAGAILESNPSLVAESFLINTMFKNVNVKILVAVALFFPICFLLCCITYCIYRGVCTFAFCCKLVPEEMSWQQCFLTTLPGGSWMSRRMQKQAEANLQQEVKTMKETLRDFLPQQDHTGDYQKKKKLWTTLAK